MMPKKKKDYQIETMSNKRDELEQAFPGRIKLRLLRLGGIFVTAAAWHSKSLFHSNFPLLPHLINLFFVAPKPISSQFSH